MLALGEEGASPRCSSTSSEDEIERIAREIAALGTVPPELGEQVLDEFHQMTSAAALQSRRGGVDHARRLLTKSLGPDHVAPHPRPRRQVVPHDRRVRVARARPIPQQLSKFILAEHPQTIALILAHLQRRPTPRSSSRCCPTTLRADVLTRMASLDEISPDVIAPHLRASSSSGCKTLGGPSREQHGGVRAVAELFNRLDRSVSQPVLERDRERRRPTLAVVDPQSDVRLRRPACTSRTTASARSSSAPTRRC